TYKQGDYKQAADLLRESVAKSPDNPEIQFHLGMAEYMMGRTDVARAALEKAVGSATDFDGKDEARRRLASLGKGGGAGENLSAASRFNLVITPGPTVYYKKAAVSFQMIPPYYMILRGRPTVWARSRKRGKQCRVY